MISSAVRLGALFLALVAAAPAFAEGDCASRLVKIDNISQAIGRRIIVEDSQAEPVDAKIATGIRDVLTVIDPYLGNLKRGDGPYFVLPLTENYLAYANPEGIFVDPDKVYAQRLSPRNIRIVLAHEAGHEILRLNISHAGELHDLRNGTNEKFDWMLNPYHETFAAINVLLFTNGDPRAEASLIFESGHTEKTANMFRWDMDVPLNREVPAGDLYRYQFFRGARSYLWKKYFAGAKRRDYALLMEVFIRATERHLIVRKGRGELEMQTYTWTRRAPQLNREFIELFDEEYAKARTPRI